MQLNIRTDSDLGPFAQIKFDNDSDFEYEKSFPWDKHYVLNIGSKIVLCNWRQRYRIEVISHPGFNVPEIWSFSSIIVIMMMVKHEDALVITLPVLKRF